MVLNESRKRQRRIVVLATYPSMSTTTSRLVFRSIMISLIASATMLFSSSAFTVPIISPCYRETTTKIFFSTLVSDSSIRPLGVTPRLFSSLLKTSHGVRATTMWMASTSSSSRSSNTVQPNFQSDDPYLVLGISRSVVGLDKKELKRIYKRLALQYHPDMITNIQSTVSEKKVASDNFAKINRAYETLTRNITDNTSARGGNANQGKSSSTAQDEWVPPHRRPSSSYARSSTSEQPNNYGSQGTGNNYGDSDQFKRNIYNENDSKYDAGGDSFGKIFSDLMNDVATVASSRSGSSNSMGGSGIFVDFVEFLEKNINGGDSNIGGSASRAKSLDDDAELRLLLQTSNIEEIGNEMDETDFIVQQLINKKQSIMNDIIMITAEVKLASSYSEKITLEEQLDEFNAKSNILVKYIKDAQKRLLALQNRYKELIVNNGANSDPRVRRNQQQASTASRAYDDIKRESTTNPTSNGSNRSTASSGRSDSSSNREAGNKKDNNTDRMNNDEEESWKTESFGSFGRTRSGRGSTSRARRPSTGTSSGGQPRSDSYTAYTNNRASASSQSNYSPRSAVTPSTVVDPMVPPHRRPSSAYSSEYDQYIRKEEDKRRLREIKVDEEFDKLKKDLGL